MSLKERCPIIKFDSHVDERGKLIVIEGGQSIPFQIKRVFYMLGTDDSAVRGKHANRESEFILINISGHCEVKVADGFEEFIVALDEPMFGIYIPKMIWKEMFNFSKDSILLVLASTHYDNSEYIYDFLEYKKEMK